MSPDSPGVVGPEMTTEEKYHVFLSHSHQYEEWVEALAGRLTDEHGFKVWLDRWVLIPGQSWQQEMAKGLEEAKACAVCVGQSTPRGWFQQEVEKALNRQASDTSFRVIPVLLPDAPSDPAEIMPAFLDLRTWVNYREGADPDYAFHVLAQGIKGKPVGRWPLAKEDTLVPSTESRFAVAERQLKEFRKLSAAAGGFSEVVKIEYEQKILQDWLRKGP
jgi:TIR domain-containing protein